MAAREEAYSDFIRNQIDDLQDANALLSTLLNALGEVDADTGRVLILAHRKIDQVLSELTISENRY